MISAAIVSIIDRVTALGRALVAFETLGADGFVAQLQAFIDR
jgi:hypothetical protein